MKSSSLMQQMAEDYMNATSPSTWTEQGDCYGDYQIEMAYLAGFRAAREMAAQKLDDGREFEWADTVRKLGDSGE
jgi:hypothetical protein